MLKTMIVGALASLCLAACGGGGSGSSSDTQPAAKALTISMYGKPLVSAPAPAVAHAQVSAISKAAAATPASGASDVQATVESLQDALAARGVTADITPQVMDGTTLHQIVTTEHDGIAPTPDQFKVDPSEWLIVNFQLDDMVTPASDPAQQAATAQFSQDLLVFSQWAAVAGKAVFVIMPIITCDTMYSASSGLNTAIINAFGNGAPIRMINETAFLVGFGTDGNPIVNDGQDLSHLGADCRTPDAYLQNLLVNATADTIASAYQQPSAASAASGASASGM